MPKQKKSGLPPYTFRDSARGVMHRPYLGRQGGKVKWGTRIWLAHVDAPLDEIWASYEFMRANKVRMENVMRETNTPEMTNSASLVSEVFADNLKRYMTEYDISTNGVALKKGISQKTLWVTVNKVNVPTLDTAKKICDALDVDFALCVSRELTAEQVASSKKLARAIDTVLACGVSKAA